MKKRILIVEDERIIAEDLQRTLENLGYSVAAIVPSGEEAVEIAATHNPDLVLMDIVLSGEMDGIAAAEQIRSCFKIPVVFLTAYGDEQTLKRAKLTEPFGYILKPFDNRELHITIEIAFHKSQTEKRIEHLNAVLRAVRGVSQVITPEIERDRLIQHACDKLIETRGYLTAWIALLDESGRFVQAAESGLGNNFHPLPERLQRGELIYCALQALTQTAPVVILNPPSACGDCPLAHQYQGRVAMTCRLEYNGQTYGLLSVSIPPEMAIYPEERELFQDVGEDLGFALHSIELREARQRSEEARQASEVQMRNLIESAPLGISIVQHGKYVYVNPAWLKMFGYDHAREILGREVGSFTVPELREMVRQRRSDSLAGREVPPYEVKTLKKNGQTFNVAVRLALIDYQGEPATLAFIIDVSAEKNLRAQLQQAQKMEAVGTLASGIAHDFNNILQAIQGYAEILLLELDNDHPGFAELKTINKAAQQGAKLIQQILTLGRKAESNLQPVNLNEAIEKIEKILVRTIPRMIAIELRQARNLWTVHADPIQLEQVLLNLAVNARDAMPAGGKLILATENLTLDHQHRQDHLGVKPGDYVLLSVSDTGCGMSKELMERIFEPFFTTKEPGRGTGLGLAMVYGVVQSHGGYINCSSEPGKGTTFRIYLPALDKAGELAQPVVKKALEVSWQGTETILFVDDEETLRDLGQNMLKRYGYQVITAASGEEALQIYRQQARYLDLVILDLSMPGMGGKRCLEELIGLDPQARVVLTSGFNEDSVGQEVFQAKKTWFLRKPYNLRQLLTTVRGILDKF
ncbi:MAG: response regulator [Deltaproteobacteria bacterium]|nr:response regulator [Deltaproteobacteria bacterium]